MSINLVLFWFTLIGLCAAAFRWGSRPERLVSLMYLAAAISTALFRSAFSVRYSSIEPGTFLIDLLLLAGLVAVTAGSDRWWIICATAFQGLAVLAHIGKAINPHLGRFGYQLMAVWSAWPCLLVLAIGIIVQARRKRKIDDT